jgi:hypothetical protein
VHQSAIAIDAALFDMEACIAGSSGCEIVRLYGHHIENRLFPFLAEGADSGNRNQQ